GSESRTPAWKLLNTISLFLIIFDATIKAFKCYNEEMSSMRHMVLQNRLVLDLLVAQEGCVCKMLNDTCCTFIPDNIDEGHSITEIFASPTSQTWRGEETPRPRAPPASGRPPYRCPPGTKRHRRTRRPAPKPQDRSA
uniref:Uncharacterized protein n=1 Tax=Oryzias latipes TaxID=8090 RepID=A0A3P9J6E2_ORYLA